MKNHDIESSQWPPLSSCVQKEKIQDVGLRGKQYSIARLNNIICCIPIRLCSKTELCHTNKKYKYGLH